MRASSEAIEASAENMDAVRARLEELSVALRSPEDVSGMD